MSGCGPETWARFFRPPCSIFFEASCDKHDDGYGNGGTELRRYECDVKFYAAMISDCQMSDRPWFYASWATLYFILVRCFGWMFFRYRQNDIEKTD